ncbi:putative transposase, partial [Rhizoctonia solani 123E]
PFNVVESPEFRDFILFTGQGHLQDKDVPHRDKIVAVAEAMYYVEKNLIDSDMKAARGFISLTSDLWSDPILHAFMAVTAHYIDQNGLLKDHLIAFRKIDGVHSGANLADAMYKILRQSGIAYKVGYITLDNASNNNTMMRELAGSLKAHGLVFDADLNRLQCFPHILNLAVQAITSALSESAKRHRQKMREAGLYVSSAEERYLDALESDPLEAIRTSIHACRASGTRREDFSKMIEHGNNEGTFHLPDGTSIIIPNRQLLRDSPTRWGSTYIMSGRYIEVYPAIVELAYQCRKTAHIPFITHAQYETVQDLLTVLSIGYNAQELLSAEKTPTLSLVFPLFESIIQNWKQLADTIPELRHAISCGIKKIYDYMGRANKVPAHTIAMFLNPMFKMDWFYSKWEHEDAERAVSIIKTEVSLGH